ncbi:LacI family transcriptional regulator [Nocardioidaceae bacterium SCSIO 66511]|nr:LacI family transcriptional regulator [Nocardioidaceae bacterium SCSIO 66511]
MSAHRRTPRLPDVARLAEVSPGLVSRILNEDPNLKVRPETRERVLSAIELLQYTPHASARALRSSQTALLGFALHHVNDPIYAEMVEAAQTAAAERKYSIVMLDADALGRSETARALVHGHRVDGLLIQSGYAVESRNLQEVAAAIPTLVFNAGATPGLRTLRLDDTAAAALATRHLIEAGHTDIAFVGARGGSTDRRFQGYLEELTRHGLTQRPAIDADWDADSARQATARHFAAGGRPTGIVAVTATSALGVHAGVVSAGLSIPTDVSIVGIHDTWFAPHLNPALTTVMLPLADVGRRAVELVLDQIREPTEGESVLAEPAPVLVERASVGPPPGDAR